ncbi:MAG TPA: aminopeptidase P family N-terminal domain-containing protein, partial [Arenibaculum sp.]|nr:aminopeptidase P family N-terminal domain-containing protein [Arenibaculum sp.]
MDKTPAALPVVDTAGSPSLADSLSGAFDPVRLRADRLAKVREMMHRTGLTAVVLFDPFNQRYATGSRNMFGYFLRNSTRYVYVPLDGPVILFEYPGSQHVSTWLETIDEARTSKVVWSSVNQKDTATARPFAGEIAELAKARGDGRPRVGLDRCFHMQALALQEHGVEVVDCQADLLHTRRLKTPDEIACLALSMSASEAAVAAVERAIRPGVSENDLFAEMYRETIAGGGEFIETRLLASGPRSNPWFQEASDRRVRPTELVLLDT